MTFLMTQLEGDNVTLSRADGGQLVVFPSTGSQGGVGVLIFPNIATMSAYAQSGLLDGQPARVESNGSKWTLKTTGIGADGITIATSTVAGAKWVRDGSYITATSVKQTAWVVDLNNSTGHASDENTGLDVSHPLLTKAEVFRRWGYTWAPVIDGTVVTILYLGQDLVGSDGAGTDTGFFAPKLINGAQFIQTAQAPASSFTGTIATLTAKNSATNTPLQASFTATTGAVEELMMLVNSTRSSIAFAVRVLEGNTWLLTQPFTAVEPDADVPGPDNTWAVTDAITGYVLPNVDIAVVGGVAAAEPTSDVGAVFSHVVTNMTIADPQGAGSQNPLNVDASCFPLIGQCVMQRQLNWAGDATMFPGVCVNVMALYSPTIAGDGKSALMQFEGGLFATNAGEEGASMRNALVEQDTIVSFLTTFEDCFIEDVYIDEDVTVNALGSCLVEGVMYGPGGLSVNSGVLRLSSSAVGTLNLTGGITFGGVNSAYSNATTAGVVAVHLIAGITAAKIDAAAGAAGFGGLAYIPGVASIWHGTTP